MRSTLMNDPNICGENDIHAKISDDTVIYGCATQYDLDVRSCIDRLGKVPTNQSACAYFHPVSGPANHKMSVAWQIVFTFIPIADLWAFYRIKRLKKYILYVVVPQIAVSIIINYFSFRRIADDEPIRFLYPGFAT
jgi:hypothetical protein